ncbi:MAG: HAMP domain-containing histidine kinase, partial [Prevotella sp.]|nr:HAMP domain-containing histidine kinase [Prevotella sp.]
LNERTAREREEMIRQTAREREQWLAVVIGLLLTALCLIVWRHLTRRRYQKQLLRQNKALETALDRAQESDRMKMAFIEQVSHEIRTPLNVVTGFSQVIANPEYQLDEQERRQMLDAINRNTQEITNIVGELLDVAEEESHNYPVSADNVNIDQLCREVMARAETVNNGRLQLSYVNQLAEGYTLLTNRQALTKVLNQLMKNSLKFTQQGSIELKVRERAANGGIEFAVTDTGIGIDAKYSEKIFERFYKVDPFKQGMGLGLTMGRKIATVLGGTLTLDTAWQKGARFLLVLPVGQRQL